MNGDWNVDENPDDEVVTAQEMREAAITNRGEEWIPMDYCGGEYDE
jgi:hypothetical protein